MIIANKEENVKEQLTLLAEDIPVLVTDISTYEDAIDVIRSISMFLNVSVSGELLINKIESRFNQLICDKYYSIAYLIWKDPYMTVGGNTFISSMIEKAGFINVFNDKLRYPQITEKDIIEKDPDFIFLSSEPYPFSEKHKLDLVTNYPLERIKIVDGECFSWYGSRLLKAATYFKKREFIQ